MVLMGWVVVTALAGMATAEVVILAEVEMGTEEMRETVMMVAVGAAVAL